MTLRFGRIAEVPVGLPQPVGAARLRGLRVLVVEDEKVNQLTARAMRELEQHAVLGIARLAGQAILDVVREGFSVEEKPDHSPLTTADTRSCRVILDGLARAFPGVPILCEETKNAPYAERRSWKRLFVVDPLDGTKEFVRGTGEYCVCIALVERGRPVFGAIHGRGLPGAVVLAHGLREPAAHGRRPGEGQGPCRG